MLKLLASIQCLLNALVPVLLGVGAPHRALTADAPKEKAKPDTIVCWENDAEDYRLIAVDLKDKKSRRLTDKLPPEQVLTDAPVLVSPDGKWAAYPGTRLAGEDETGNGIVHIGALDKPDGKGRSLEVKGLPLCWSPDGKQLIVTDFDDDGMAQTRIDVASGKRESLRVPAIKTPNDDGDSYVHFVSDWSRDGKSWLVVRWNQKDEKAGLKAQVYLTKSDGSEPRELKHIGPALIARFSPDGRKIVYYAPDGEKGEKPPQLLVADLAPSKPRRISPMNGSVGEVDFCWSPNGKRIAYIWDNDQKGADAEQFLIVVDADGSNEQIVHSVKGEERRLASPNWR